MSHRLPILAAALVCSAAVVSAGEPALADAAGSAKSETAPAYALKKRSAFSNVDANGRAPFWPIGWVKRAKGTVATQALPSEPRVRLEEKSFKVTSIMLGAGTTPSLAVINGRAYSEGEFLRMPKGSATPPARVRVQQISDGVVMLQNADQVMVASLARPELPERSSEEVLLDPDR